MCEESKLPETCAKSFDVLFEKFDKLDVAIRGNGKPGINTRLDRVEQMAKVACYVGALIIAALIAVWIK